MWYFDLLNACGYIKRIVKSDFFPEKTFYTSYVRVMFLVTILYKHHEREERERGASQAFIAELVLQNT